MDGTAAREFNNNSLCQPVSFVILINLGLINLGLINLGLINLGLINQQV